MSKKQYTVEKAAELLTADNASDGNDLESSSEDDLSCIGEDENQPRKRGNNFSKVFNRINHIRLLYLYVQLQLKTIRSKI